VPDRRAGLWIAIQDRCRRFFTYSHTALLYTASSCAAPIQQYRRLGNGAAFYGKRKSNFYGEQDKNRKTDREQDDPTEDYQGPSNAGYFQWAPDEDGQMRPVTRMKNQIVERNPKYWDRVYEKEDE
jgi:hypothetical protein